MLIYIYFFSLIFKDVVVVAWVASEEHVGDLEPSNTTRNETPASQTEDRVS